MVNVKGDGGLAVTLHTCDRCGAQKHGGLMVPHADGHPSRLCLECERQLGWFKEKCQPTKGGTHGRNSETCTSIADGPS